MSWRWAAGIIKAWPCRDRQWHIEERITMSWLGPNEFGRGGDYEGGGQQEEDQVHGRGGQQDGRGGQMFPVGSQRDLTHSLLGAAMPLMDRKYVQLLKQTHIWVPHFIFTCVANLPKSTFAVTTRWYPLTLLEFTILHTSIFMYATLQLIQSFSN